MSKNECFLFLYFLVPRLPPAPQQNTCAVNMHYILPWKFYMHIINDDAFIHSFIHSLHGQASFDVHRCSFLPHRLRSQDNGGAPPLPRLPGLTTDSSSNNTHFFISPSQVRLETGFRSVLSGAGELVWRTR